MKKVKTVLIISMLVLVMVITLPAAASSANAFRSGNFCAVYASSDNGADAHSNSMSVGSGDEEVNKAKSDEKSEKADSAPAEYDNSQSTDEAGFSQEQQVKTGDDAAKEQGVEDQVGKNDISKDGKKFLSLWIIIIIAVALAALAAAVLLFRSRRKDKYESKH